MNSVPLEYSLFLSGILFFIGFFGVLIRRDIIFVLLSIEAMLNASSLAFIAAGSRWQAPDGQVFFFFILATAAAEVSVGLALVLQMNHQFKTLDIDSLDQMKG